MGGKLYTSGIVLVWLLVMSWLVSERILPAFFRGEPPRSLGSQQTTPVAWHIQADDKPCGIAVVQAVKSEYDVMTVHSLVSLDRIPWPKSAPIWMSAFKSSIGSLSVDMRTRIGFDTLERLADFETKFLIDDQTQPVVLRGEINGGKLKLKVKAASITKTFEHAWSHDGIIASEMMPETKILGVYPGRKWQKEVFSPIGSPHRPIELLQVEVAPSERYEFDGKIYRVNPVEYRTAERVGTSNAERLRARVLVAENGEVLKQQIYFMGSSLTFTRMNDQASEAMAITRLKISDYAPSAPIPYN